MNTPLIARRSISLFSQSIKKKRNAAFVRIGQRSTLLKRQSSYCVFVKKLAFAPLVIIALSISLAGCGSSDKSSSKASDSSSTTEKANSKTTGTAAPTESIASVDGNLKSTPFHIDITSLKRSSDLMTLTFVLKNTATVDTSSIGYQLAGTFDTATPGPKLSSTLSGVYLVDNVNKKKYTPAIDSAGDCVCSDNLGSVFVKAGQSTTLSATYGAPPASVKNVDVYIPQFGTLSSVAISG
jgi:hypothetical protein